MPRKKTIEIEKRNSLPSSTDNAHSQHQEQLEQEGVQAFERLPLKQLANFTPSGYAVFQKRAQHMLLPFLVDMLVKHYNKLYTDNEELKESVNQYQRYCNNCSDVKNRSEFDNENSSYQKPEPYLFLDKSLIEKEANVEPCQSTISSLQAQLDKLLGPQSKLRMRITQPDSISIDYNHKGFKETLSCTIPQLLLEQILWRAYDSISLAPPEQKMRPCAIDLVYQTLSELQKDKISYDEMAFMEFPIFAVGEKEAAIFELLPTIDIRLALKSKTLLTQLAQGRGQQRLQNRLDFSGFCLGLSQNYIEACHKLEKHNTQLCQQLSDLRQQYQEQKNKQTQQQILSRLASSSSLEQNSIHPITQKWQAITHNTLAITSTLPSKSRALTWVSGVIQQSIQPVYNAKIKQLEHEIATVQQQKEYIESDTIQYKHRHQTMATQTQQLQREIQMLYQKYAHVKQSLNDAYHQWKDLLENGFNPYEDKDDDYFDLQMPLWSQVHNLRRQCEQLQTLHRNKQQEYDELVEQAQHQRVKLSYLRWCGGDATELEVDRSNKSQIIPNK